MAACLGAAVALAAVALGIGTLGYHQFAGFTWIDSLLNAAMILTGMGPVGSLTTTGAKLFATAYALFSGLVVLTIIVTVLTPLVHRLLHHFHLEDAEPREQRQPAKPRTRSDKQG
jgi:hypothetical protein